LFLLSSATNFFIIASLSLPSPIIFYLNRRFFLSSASIIFLS
jgi:hypothetical protein